MNSTPRLRFTRLTEVPLEAIRAHMRHPRLAEHMPLLKGAWDLTQCQALVDTKEAHWKRDGLGHWAFLANGHYAGWGGFQKEGEDWDFGLVLHPDHFGLGLPITRKALTFARQTAKLDAITFLLPPSRQHLKALLRLGAQELAATHYDGHEFRKFRLDLAPA
nr:GNAT family N-acetyltransferase [Maricaulis parjimensis]